MIAGNYSVSFRKKCGLRTLQYVPSWCQNIKYFNHSNHEIKINNASANHSIKDLVKLYACKNKSDENYVDIFVGKDMLCYENYIDHKNHHLRALPGALVRVVCLWVELIPFTLRPEILWQFYLVFIVSEKLWQIDLYPADICTRYQRLSTRSLSNIFLTGWHYSNRCPDRP